MLHYASRLNLGVRLLGNINTFSKQHLLLKGGFGSARHLPAGCLRAVDAIAGRSKASSVAAERPNVWVHVLPIFHVVHALADHVLAFGYNGNSARPQPNNSFKLTSLRGTRFCGSVYHNAVPLRSAT